MATLPVTTSSVEPIIQQLAVLPRLPFYVQQFQEMYEPGICFFHQERAQLFVPDQMKFPAPDFVVETLSNATEPYDRGVKFDDYAAHNVTEYWIIDPPPETVEQYLLDAASQNYSLNVRVKTGTLQSVAVTGFEIPVRAIFDDQEHWQALQAIVAAA